mgnify:CR=1 FL=1
MAKFEEHDWVEITDGAHKGRKGFVMKRWNEAGIGTLYEVYFRDNKGRGSTYGIAERALKSTTFNSRVRSSNAVVQSALDAMTGKTAANAAFKRGDKVWVCWLDGTREKGVVISHEPEKKRWVVRSNESGQLVDRKSVV